jgi:dipeptidyl aminopeptidase/acylaminoacyl peptidase
VLVEYDLVKQSQRDVLPEQYNCSAQVHSYGGQAFSCSEASGHLIFTDIHTKGVLGLDAETGETIPIVEANKDVYYADFAVHPLRPHLTAAIQERHDVATIADVKNSLVVIDSSTKEVTVLVAGTDFVTSPRFSPDGTKLCWVQFNFPNMPWDNTELWLADFEDNGIKNSRCIAGGEKKASITQPRWSPDNILYYISDESNFWQIYAYQNNETRHLKFAGLENAEFG